MMMKLDELHGLMTPMACARLYELARLVPTDLAIVEIGSYKGQSTCHLAAGARVGNGAHVWAVDPWDLPGNENGKHGYAEAATRATFDRQVAALGLEDHITPLQGFSVEVAATWSGPSIGLLYIDGDHRARSVRADWEAWWPYLDAEAVVVFDDLDTPRNPGVRAVLEDLSGELRWNKEAGRLAVGRLVL